MKQPLLSSIIAQAEFNYKNYFGIKHTKVPDYILQKIKPDSVIIDCGANVGEVSFPLVGTGALLFCFEPHPVAFKALNKRFENVSNVKLFDAAVGVVEHKAKLYKHVQSTNDELKYSTGSSLYSTKNNVNPNDYYEINVINLPEFIDSLTSRIFMLKVDIEGAEIELLNKLIDEGTYKKIDYIFVETHESKMPALKVPTQELKERIKRLKIKNIYTNWT